MGFMSISLLAFLSAVSGSPRRKDAAIASGTDRQNESGTNYDDLAEEILRLRELQEQTVMDDAAKAAHRERIQELLHFINSQPRTITEFDEALVKKLLESVKVCEFFLEFRFKSGMTLSIEK